MEKYDLVCVWGPPLVGKGTQINLMRDFFEEKKISYQYIGTGDKMRALPESNYTKQRIKKIVASGGLVPDFIANTFVGSQFLFYFLEGSVIFLDGFPRTKNQAKELRDMIEFYEFNPKIIFLRAHVKEIKKRMEVRKTTENRSDDTLEAVINRFIEFRKKSIPIINYLKSHGIEAVEVDGEGSPKEVHLRILKVLNY